MVTPCCGQQLGQASTHHSATTHGVLLPSPFSAADLLGLGSTWPISRATFLSRVTFLLPGSGPPPWQQSSIGFSRTTWRLSVWKHLPSVFYRQLPRGVAQAWLCLQSPIVPAISPGLSLLQCGFLATVTVSALIPSSARAWTLC